MMTTGTLTEMTPMLDFIKEKNDCWEFLRSTELPIFIYGMGDGAEKILRVFDMYNIPTAGFFASDEFVRGHYFKGHLVHSLSQIEALIDDFIIVLAFGAGYESLYNRINDMAKRHTLLAPDVPVVGDGLFTYSYCMENADKLQKVYDLLADDISKQTFADVVNFRISGKIEYLNACTFPRERIFTDIIRLGDDEEYIDMGAYNGDTVLEFADITGGKYRRIFAMEPDTRNFRKLTKSTDGGGVKLKQVAALRGDSLSENATFIKMDVEGAERHALEGCAQSLKNGSKLICALYHRTEDIFDLPLLVHEINPDLKLYIRHLMYIPAWETNLYCVPNTNNHLT